MYSDKSLYNLPQFSLDELHGWSEGAANDGLLSERGEEDYLGI